MKAVGIVAVIIGAVLVLISIRSVFSAGEMVPQVIAGAVIAIVGILLYVRAK